MFLRVQRNVFLRLCRTAHNEIHKMNPKKLVKHPFVQITAIYLLWQFVLFTIYRTLTWKLPSIFSSGPVAFLMPEAIPAASAIVAFWIMLRLMRLGTFASFGFTRRGCFSELLIGFLLGILGYAGYIVISWLGGWYHFATVNPNYYFRYALLFCLLLAIAEETIFRGYAFQVLERRWGTKTALFGSSLFFGLAHVVNLSGGGRWQSGHFLDWILQPILSGFIGGLLFGGAFLLTRRMWLPIGLHCAWNTGVTVFFNDPFGISSYFQSNINVGAYQITGSAFWIVSFFMVVFATMLLFVGKKKGNWITR